MIKLLKSKIRYRAFRRAALTEDTKIPANPLRGWFDLYAFELDGDTEQFKSEAKERMDKDTCLILLLADISAYKDGDITDEALFNLEQIISFFRPFVIPGSDRESHSQPHPCTSSRQEARSHRHREGPHRHG